jgi:hypothetical protein
MPRDGAIILGDLIGTRGVLHLHCGKCNRTGRYRVQHLIEERGPRCQANRLARQNHRRLSEVSPESRH